MKLFRWSLFSRSSRYVVHKDESDSELESNDVWTSVTVWRKSLVFGCHGFTVIDSSGNLVYRVDNYMAARPDEIVLMDGYGYPILTLVRHEKLRVLQSWIVYNGENGSGHSVRKEAMYTVKKQTRIVGRPCSSRFTEVIANVYLGASSKKQDVAYTIRGSYSHRSCKIIEGSKRSDKVVAEIKRKEVTMKSGEGVALGLEVFVLSVRAEFDRGVAMGLVILLDQMFS